MREVKNFLKYYYEQAIKPSIIIAFLHVAALFMLVYAVLTFDTWHLILLFINLCIATLVPLVIGVLFYK